MFGMRVLDSMKYTHCIKHARGSSKHASDVEHARAGPKLGEAHGRALAATVEASLRGTAMMDGYLQFHPPVLQPEYWGFGRAGQRSAFGDNGTGPKRRLAAGPVHAVSLISTSGWRDAGTPLSIGSCGPR